MKKILYTCAALSVLYTASALAQTLPSQPAPNNELTINQSTKQTAPAPHPKQIASAIEIGILYYGFDALTPPQVEQKGQDFLISIPQTQRTNSSGSVQSFPATQILMTRVDDFDGHAQYKMGNITLPYLKNILSTFYPQGKLTQNNYQEEIFWVPDLALRTKQSLKTENLNFDTGAGTNLTIASLYSDSLIGSKTDHKMDAASSLDIRDLTLQNEIFKLVIPHLNISTQILDADQTADVFQQTLSAILSRGNLSIPEMNLTPSTALFAPLNLRSDIRFETIQDPKTHEIQTHLTLDNTLLNLSAKDFESGSLPALFPEDIKLDIVLSGLNTNQIQSIIEMQRKLDESMDEDSEQGIALQHELQTQINDALNKVRLNINEVALENPIAAVHFSGTGRFVNQTAQLNGQLAVTNFDLISPDYQSQCAAERAQQPKTDKQSAVATEPAVCSSVGVLDSLRPYLNSAEKLTQNGKPVSLFKIEYKNGQTFVNDKPFAAPNAEASLTENSAAQK